MSRDINAYVWHTRNRLEVWVLRRRGAATVGTKEVARIPDSHNCSDGFRPLVLGHWTLSLGAPHTAQSVASPATSRRDHRDAAGGNLSCYLGVQIFKEVLFATT